MSQNRGGGGLHPWFRRPCKAYYLHHSIYIVAYTLCYSQFASKHLLSKSVYRINILCTKGYFRSIDRIMLTLKELNCKDFESFRTHLNNVVFGNSMVGALWDHRPFSSIENLMLQLSEILHSLPISGK